MKKKLLIGSLVVVVILLCIFYFVVLKNKKNKVVTEGVEVVPTMNDKIDSDSTWCGIFCVQTPPSVSGSPVPHNNDIPDV